MNEREWFQITAYVGLLIIFTPLLGGFMARVFSGERTFLTRLLSPVERWVYRLAGCDPKAEMRWTTYAVALLLFNLLGFLAVFALQYCQVWLPLNPQKFPNVPPALAFNTAVSFVTNTNWQAYSGEATLSYLVQMLGLAVQNFLSAATGIAVLLALTRGLARRSAATLGNFWADLVRSTLYVLLPLSLIFALVLVSQGVVQTFSPYANAISVEGGAHQIPLGPAAAQIAIKQLGTNGGGFFGLNSAHPFENPTPLTNFLEMLAILLIPAALTYAYGIMVGSRRQGWAIFAAMMILFLGGLAGALFAEYSNNTVLPNTAHVEGKETRFGVANSVLWATATTAASNGSVNAMHDSLSPLAGLVALFNLMLGEVVFGGVGAGLYGMLMMVILTVFMAGLMVGRTPEYLGKKIERREVVMAMLAVLAPCAVVLIGSALASVMPAGLSSLNNQGPHGLSEILYAFASMANNNGSAFAGLNANTNFYNLLGALAMLIGRFVVIIPALAIAGSMVSKRSSPPSTGTFPTDGGLFVVMLIAVIVIVGALTFFPALTLGPIIEHLLVKQGRTF
jgi:potassium-transporting ATPase potassium-binding subunit